MDRSTLSVITGRWIPVFAMCCATVLFAVSCGGEQAVTSAADQTEQEIEVQAPDNDAPQILEFSLTGDNPFSETHVKNGDNVAVTFRTNEILGAVPAVSIGGIEAEVVGPTQEMRYTAERPITPSDTDGLISVSISIEDAVGNRTARDLDSDVAIDNRVPIIRTVSISSSNPLSQRAARRGDTVTIDFTVNEDLGQTPLVRFNRERADEVTQISRWRYRAVKRIDDGNGTARFSVYVQDAAGNAASIADVTTDSSRVVLDNSGPEIINPIVMVSAEESGTIGPADAITVTFGVISNGNQYPEVMINTVPASVEYQTGAALYVASLPMTQIRGLGPIEIIIEARDDAGNRSIRQLSPSGIVFDPSHQRTKIVRKLSTPVDDERKVTPSAVADAIVPKQTELDDTPVEQTSPLPPKTTLKKEPVSEPEPDISPPPIEETPLVQIAAAPEPEVSSPPLEEELPVVEITAPPEPGVAISSPVAGTDVGAYVEVLGTVGGIEGLDELRYSVTPTSFVGQESAFIEGATAVENDGSFAILFSTASLSGDQDIIVTAIYETGDEIIAKLTVRHSGAGIPNLHARYDDGEVQLRWDEVPSLQDYRLRFTDDGTDPGSDRAFLVSTNGLETSVTDVVTGRLYSFQIYATGHDGETVSSEVYRVIPLFTRSLKPTVVAGYKRLRLSWTAIEGTDRYTIYRSSGELFEPIAIGIAGTTYEDTTVSYGTTYAYRVAPEKFGTTLSDSVSAEPLAVPEERIGTLGVASIDVPGKSAVRGSYAYVATGLNGLTVVDISDVAAPIAIGVVETEDARDVQILGDFAYVADGERGLKVVDIYVPGEPKITGSRKTSDANAVAVTTTADEKVIAYIADRTYGIKVIDATNPRDPKRVANVPGTDVRDVTVYDDRYLVAADVVDGILIYPLDDLSSLVHTVPLSGSVSIDIDDGIIAVAQGTEGISFIDIRDIDRVEEMGTITGGNFTDIQIADGFGYAACNTNELRIYNITSPRLPVLYDTISMNGISALSARGSRIFASIESGLSIVNNYTSGTSAQVAAVKTDGNAFGVSLITLSNGAKVACVADHRGGLKIYDAEPPDGIDATSLLLTIQTEFARDVAYTGSHLVVADGHAGLKVYSEAALRDTNDSAPVDEMDTDGNARSLSYSNGYLYVADGNRGVSTYTLSPSGQLTFVSALQTEYAVDATLGVSSATAQGDGLLYVADGDGGFLILRSDAGQLSVVGGLEIANVRSVAVYGDTACVVGSSGLSLVDVSNPTTPVVVGHYETGYAENVVRNGSFAYLVEGIKGLTVLDVSDPAAPYVVSRGNNAFAVGVAVDGDYAFIADSEGLKVLEVVIPSWVLREQN